MEARVGKNGRCIFCLISGISNLVNYILEIGGKPKNIIECLGDLTCEGANDIGESPHKSCLDSLARDIKEYEKKG
jgi:hypothetical protein